MTTYAQLQRGMNRQTLLILGYSARAAAWSARRAGWDTFCGDAFADADTRTMATVEHVERFPQDVARVASLAPQGPWIYTGGLDNHPRLIARIARQRPLLGIGAAAVREARNPRSIDRVLRAIGFPLPRIETDQAQLTPDCKWLLKRARGSGGTHIRRWTGREAIARGDYWQEEKEGLPIGAVYIADHIGATLLGVTHQFIGRDWSAPREFAYAGSIGPIDVGAEHTASLQTIGAALAEAFGFRGLFNVDFILAPDRLWPLEVNPRYSASVEILERALDVRAIDLHAQSCGDGAIRFAAPAPRQIHGKAIFYPRSPIVSPDPETVFQAFEPSATFPIVADVPMQGARFDAGDPFATVFASGASVAAVAEQLRQRLGELDQLLQRHQHTRLAR